MKISNLQSQPDFSPSLSVSITVLRDWLSGPSCCGQVVCAWEDVYGDGLQPQSDGWHRTRATHPIRHRTSVGRKLPDPGNITTFLWRFPMNQVHRHRHGAACSCNRWLLSAPRYTSRTAQQAFELFSGELEGPVRSKREAATGMCSVS